MKHSEIHRVLDGLLRLDDAQRLPELPNFGISIKHSECCSSHR